MDVEYEISKGIITNDFLQKKTKQNENFQHLQFGKY